ncbi:MAG: GNAT family N-acetyltransferase [Fluviicola sp.]
MNVRIAQLADVKAIRTIAEITWPVAYADIITPEQITYMLNWMYAEDVIKEAIQSNDQDFLVLEENGNMLGFAGIQYDYPEKGICRIHKLYVLPETQGKGAGKKLLHAIEHAARQKGLTLLHLNVNKANKAVDFYKHNGFVVSETIVLDIGNGFVMDDYIMTKAL